MPGEDLRRIAALLEEMHGISAILQQQVWNFLATKPEHFDQPSLSEFAKLASHFQATNRQAETYILLVSSHLPAFNINPQLRTCVTAETGRHDAGKGNDT